MACQKPLHMKYEGMTNCLGVGEYLKRSLNSIVAIITMASLLNIPIEAQAQTKTYIASLAVMPQSAEIADDGSLTGAYVELIRALDHLTNIRTEMNIVPFKRSVRNLILGEADYHIPLIRIPGVDMKQLPYAFSTDTLFQVPFVLYTNKNSPVDIENLSEHSIITDSAHIDFFPFPVEGLSCLPCAIRMVDMGRVDGFIFAQNEIDPIIKELELTNVHRQLYKNFDVKILIPKGENGQEID